MSRRRGYTLIEILIVASIIGILTGLITPQYRHVRKKAQAARIVGDFHAIRIAAFSYHADSRRWPRDVSRGVVPPEMRPYLPGNFSFSKPEYVFDWENWVSVDLRQTGQGEVLGISVVTSDRELLQEVGNLLGDALTMDLGDRRTFFIDGL